MKKKIIALLLCIVVFIGGCACQVKTPPWNQNEVEEMSSNGVNYIPIADIRF